MPPIHSVRGLGLLLFLLDHPRRLRSSLLTVSLCLNLVNLELILIFNFLI